jgi:hypothetical protein
MIINVHETLYEICIETDIALTLPLPLKRRCFRSTQPHYYYKVIFVRNYYYKAL